MRASVVAAVVAAAAAACVADAASVGYKVGSCDPLAQNWGCPVGAHGTGPDNRPDNRLNCTVNGRLMPWAVEPRDTPAFVVTAGVDEANPDTSYTPGELMTIRIRTNDRDVRFRGVLISAEAAGRTRVGAWEHAPTIPPLFSHPTLAGCENTLIHASATMKHSNLIAHWRAPPQGTGSVRFEILLKSGGANHGYFWRPQTTLVLSEGAPAQPPPLSAVRWTKSNVGESCTAACPRALGATFSCSATGFTQSTEAAMTPFFQTQDCTLPYISACGAAGPRTGAGALCYFHDAAICQATGRSLAPATCEATSSDPATGERWCPCTYDPPANQCTPLLTCPNASVACGNIGDGCGGFVGCGGCPSVHQTCVNNACTCVPHTCAEHGWQCGTHPDGCGGTITCPDSCNNAACADCSGNATHPVCVANSICSAQDCTPSAVCPSNPFGGGNGQGCGTFSTTCVETGLPVSFECGTCRAPSQCDLTTNTCNCIPHEPVVACIAACGLADDGCGGSIDCGPCPCSTGQVNRGGACVCDEDNGFALNNLGRCACPDDAAPGEDGACPIENSAPTTTATTATLLVAAAAAVVTAAGRPSASAMLVLAVVAVAVTSFTATPVAAHNWINSNSRSDNANTIKPAKPGQVMPHVQVGAGQRFQIEWQTAHTSSDLSYFITVAHSNEHLLNEITQAGLHDYLDNCPASACPGGANAVAMTGTWQRYHRKGRNGANTDNDHGVTGSTAGNRANYFLEVINPGHPDYVPRPEAWNETGYIRDTGVIDEPNGIQQYPGVPPANEVYQLRYRPADLAQDARATYNSPVYPGIISVAAFYHSAGQFIRPDFAQFEIPVGNPIGRYIVNWWWQGYYDSIDVDLVARQVPEAEKYGSLDGPDVWFQTDHAQYENPRDVMYAGCQQVADSVDHCLRNCEGNSWCEGVNVVPIHYPPDANPNYETANDDNRVPWDLNYGGDPTTVACPKGELQKAAPGSYMCFAVHAREDFGVANTLDRLTITDDPDDPVFYSRAYTKFSGAKFDLSQSVLPIAAGSWKNGNKCLTCQDAAERASDYYNYPLLVSASHTCINCDLEPYTGPIPTGPEPVTWTQVGANEEECDGAPNNDDIDGPPIWEDPSRHTCPAGTRCIKNLGPFTGRDGWRGTNFPRVEFHECQKLAKEDPECSDHVMSYYSGTNGLTDWTLPRCSCYMNTPCCGTCVPRSVNSNGQQNWGQAIYRLAP